MDRIQLLVVLSPVVATSFFIWRLYRPGKFAPTRDRAVLGLAISVFVLLIYGLLTIEGPLDQAPELLASVDTETEENGSLDPRLLAANPPIEPLVEETAAIAQIPPDNPDQGEFFGWETHCDDGCRTIAVRELAEYSDAPPLPILLEIDSDGRLLISALIDEAIHNDIYTNRAPVEYVRNGTNYVEARVFFNEHFESFLTIDGAETFQLRTLDQSHLRADGSAELINALAQGERAQLTYGPDGTYSRDLRISFALDGFSEAYANRDDSPGESSEPAPESPFTLVGRYLPGNSIGIGQSHLRSIPNPRGAGAFVFVPEIRVAGYSRKYIWFVRANQVVALNGAAKGLTPATPFPLDTGFQLWEGTGLTKMGVTQFGLELAYGR